MDKTQKLVDKHIAKYEIYKIANEHEKEAKEMHFYELSLTIRAGDIDTIKGLVPKALNHFMAGRKIGSFANDTSNYSFILVDKGKE